MVKFGMMIIEVSDNGDTHSLLPRVIKFVKKFVSADGKVRDDDY